MQAWPLERKIRVTQAKILEWYHHYGGKVAVSFSGGKDSTVLLDLARRAFPDLPAVFVDTGLDAIFKGSGNVWLSCRFQRGRTARPLCAARQFMGAAAFERLKFRWHAIKIQHEVYEMARPAGCAISHIRQVLLRDERAPLA